MKPALLLAFLCLLPLAGFSADYVGRTACTGCHQEEGKRWQGSHHDLAMQEASEETVLGNFDNASFTLHGQTARFFRRDGGFWVNTDGPDGKQHDYRIRYTFGVDPLQQYLVPFPRGRLQTLDIAWDSRPKAQGGQRWFHLHAESPVPADDVLHWTGPNLNWNYMCADCHSTNLKKNYDSASNSYHTTWSEVDVSCEACHGPGSDHLAWARAREKGEDSKLANMGLTVELDERKGIQWTTDAATGKPKRSQPNSQRKEIEVCAHCHARRGQLRDGFVPGQPFMEAYRPALLSEGLYHANGQIQDEVYVWGSFVQSRMYQGGVTCSDCHDPHSAGLRVPGEQVCYQCHQPQRYASQSHHHHEPGSAGASCVECHMPANTYMGVDRRHDHGFRIPRPDLSLTTDSPNACNQCHTDKSADWALAKVKSWYGAPPQGLQRFAPALDAARKAKPEAASLLLQLANDETQPAIARATALGYLGSAVDQAVFLTIQQNLQSEDPLLRLGALDALETAPRRMRMLAIPLAWDGIRAIRIQAARLLAGYSFEQLKPDQQQVLDRALQEYIQAQEFNAERPESQVNLGALYTDLKQYDKAEAAFRRALQLQPKFVPAWVQLARLLETRGRQREAENLLRAGLQKVPDSADLQHALGLFLVRAKRLDDAMEPLRKAAELAPANSRYAYVHAVALHSAGNTEAALKILERAHQAHPSDIALLSALVAFNRDAGNREAALKWARQLQALLPDNPEAGRLPQALERDR
ncbi:MAG: hypothetical protein DSZ02_00970 [Gammaproteobacteria bacterium]|nr:MAG: hypothetical protein DSZ02_00970 [Gammaproteobacteria bacterium]